MKALPTKMTDDAMTTQETKTMNKMIEQAQAKKDEAFKAYRAAAGTPERDARWRELLAAKRAYHEAVKQTTVAVPFSIKKHIAR